jgi:hypothetical protein
MADMTVQKRMYVILGNGDSGKTTIQKYLRRILTGGELVHNLPTNNVRPVTHPVLAQKYDKVFIGGQSFQESGRYSSVEEYFGFLEAQRVGLAFMGSWVKNAGYVDLMIREAHRRWWEIYGVFLTNSINRDRNENRQIMAARWNDQLILDNPETARVNVEQIKDQLRRAAETIVQSLVEKCLSKDTQGQC